MCLLFIAITGKHSITSGKNNPSPFLAERVPHFLSLQKKVGRLFVIGAPFLSTVGTGALSFPCRKTWDFPSHLKQVFLLLSEQVCLLFLNETGVPSISCKVGVPPRYQNKGRFSSLLVKQFFFLFFPRAALCNAYIPHLLVWAPSFPKCRFRLLVSLLRDSIYSARTRFDAEVGKIFASETCTKQDVTSQKTVICAGKFIIKNYVGRRLTALQLIRIKDYQCEVTVSEVTLSV